MLKILWIIFLLIVSNQVYAKSKCELEWKSLKAVQSQLRHKSSEYLREIEHKKHNEYQNCRKGKNKKSNTYQTKKTYKTQTKYYSNQYARNTFKNSPIKMKAKFKGVKQEAWLEQYETPKDCIKPKSTAKFASCLNSRDIKAEEFDIEWNNEHR